MSKSKFDAIAVGMTAHTRMRESGEVLVAICLDESGSMNSISEATLSAFNEYVESLKLDSAAARMFLTLTQFSDPLDGTPKARVQYEARPLAKVPTLDAKSYKPQGNTPLYDAIGHTIRSAETWQEAELGRRVLLVIQTDGYENASRDFTRGEIVSMIQRYENRGGWTAIFLGAGVDAWALGQSVGIRTAGNTLTYNHTPQSTAATSMRLTGATHYYTASADGYNPTTATLGDTLTPTITPDEEAAADKRRKHWEV